MRDQLRALLPARPQARRLLLGTLVGAVGNGMTLPFLFVYLTTVRHLDPSLVGVLVAWMGVLALVLAGPAGTLLDRLGPRRVLLPLYVVDAVGVAAYGFAHSAAGAFAAATLGAVGGSAIWAGQTTLLSTVTSEQERQRVFGLSFAILNLGIGAGGFVAGFIADVHRPDSFRLLYLISAAATLAPGIVLLSLPGIGHRPAPSADAGGGRSAGGYRDVFADRAFRRFLAFALLITVCGYAQIEVGFPAFASLQSGVSVRVIAWALAANTLTIVLAQMFVLRRMHGRSRSLGLAGVGALIGLSWLILGLTSFARNAHPALAVAGVVLCATVFACGETLMSPVMPAITNALAPDGLRGRYNAMSSIIWGITAIVGPLTAAPLIGHHHADLWVLLVVLGSAAAVLVALSLRRLLTPAQDGRLVDEKSAAMSV